MILIVGLEGCILIPPVEQVYVPVAYWWYMSQTQTDGLLFNAPAGSSLTIYHRSPLYQIRQDQKSRHLAWPQGESSRGMSRQAAL